MSTDAEVIMRPYHGVLSRWRTALDFVELTKPELTSLSVLSGLCAFYVAHVGSWTSGDVWLLVHLTVGTTLLGGGVGTLNQYLERVYDGMMRRTEKRPLPAGRLSEGAALAFGCGASMLGLVELTFLVNSLTGFLGLVTLITYLFIYTPMKRVSPVATMLGGIPGALPTTMGWTAARNELSFGVAVIFAILFLWQMPHFLSLAWLYKKDYQRAGFKLLTVADETGTRTSRHVLAHCSALLPVSLVPSVTGMTSSLYFVGALVLGLVFLGYGVRFVASFLSTRSDVLVRTNFLARRLFQASLIYLPLLLLLMVIDKM